MGQGGIELLPMLLFLIVAILYSSVGHAGASGYLAVMALLGVAAGIMRPAALLLNLVVASVGARAFISAGHLRWPLLWPFLVTSVPMAYIGGRISLPVDVYRSLVGVVLLLSALRLIMQVRAPDSPGMPPRRPVAMAVGAALGLLAGLTGVGGGIFLSPLLLLAGWANLRTTAATSVVFILANSASGLLGQLHAIESIPVTTVLPWAVAVLLGGLIGSELGARRLPSPAIRATLAVVLVVAGVKLL
ncbi:MAG TPA: sulfite exporter TauE/SafE family protein [Gemmatimonadales bacterium]|nr:sulfite exporter TauE/SafE family protein [Gemmatimonadales bacterium]